MDKRFFRVFCFLSFIVFNYSAELDTTHHDNQGIYDLIKLFEKATRNFHNSMLLKASKPLDNLQFPGIKDGFKFDVNLENSRKCTQDIMYALTNIKSEWGLKMIDSYGKPESGILNGNFRWVGDYGECVGLRVSNPNSTTVGNFRGKYCSLTWSLAAIYPALPISITQAVCLPDSCSADEFQQDTFGLLQKSGLLPVKSIFQPNALQCKPTERHLNLAAKLVIALISIFCALTVLGSSVTVAKYFVNIMKEYKGHSHAGVSYANNQMNIQANDILQKQEVPDDEALLQDDTTVTIRDPLLQKLEKFLVCFCVFTNGAKILNTDSSEGELLCIHGIRFLSMSWVIIGHTYVFGYAEMRNMIEVFRTIDTFPFQAILQAFFSVDSFFVLSGFLLTYLSMKEFSQKKGSIFWPYFYVHRYLRLTPMYMILLGFSATVYLYMGSGPYWTDAEYDVNCRAVWWKNLLYINNFDETKQCMGWSWYLANDMQFFIISPLFLIALWRWPIIGYLLLAIFLLASCLSNFFITYHFDLTNGIITFLNNGMGNMAETLIKFNDYFMKLYIKPYTRIGPYLVGMLTGYIFYKRKTSNAPKHSLVFLAIGWIIATSVTLTTVYGLYHTHPGLIARSFYNALSRISYAAGLCWVIYVCLIGQGGFINSLLSFKLFIPLSRLTYAAYLIHPMVISGYMMSLKTSLDFSHPTIVVLFLGFMLVTYAVSLPVALILESPLVGLEKLIRKQFTKQNKNVKVGFVVEQKTETEAVN